MILGTFVFICLFIKNIFAMDLYTENNSERTHIENNIKKLISEKLPYLVKNMKLIYEPHFKVKEFYHNKAHQIEDILLENFNSNTRSLSVLFWFKNGNSESLNLSYDGAVNICTSSRYIKKGSKISENDIAFGNVKISRIEDYILSKDMILGSYISRNIPARRAFRVSDLMMYYDINQDDMIALIYRSNLIELKTIGTALSKGSIGQMIRAKNNDSGAIVIGRVTAEKTLLIQE